MKDCPQVVNRMKNRRNSELLIKADLTLFKQVLPRCQQVKANHHIELVKKYKT